MSILTDALVSISTCPVADWNRSDSKAPTPSCTMALSSLQLPMPQSFASYPAPEMFRHPVDLDTMNRERNRLDTFTDWPLSFLSPERLANAGFFYLKYRDMVECAFCGVQIYGWEPEDDPVEDHEKWSPHCPFVCNLQTDNVPLVETDEIGDICGLSALTISTKPERFPSYATKESRMRSFKNWPTGLRQKPKELVDAGFYYTGQGDQTVCFHCGKGFKSWEPEDDVWVEHAKSSPNCTYLRMQKDDDFIKKALATESAVPPAVDTSADDEESSSTDDLESVCKICLDKKSSVVFLPCKHMVACEECAINLKKCAVCRQKIDSFLKVYRA